MRRLPGAARANRGRFIAYFFDLTGRGFFALLIYLGLIAVYWKAPEAALRVSGGRPVGRNDPCACGSGRKYTRCCLA